MLTAFKEINRLQIGFKAADEFLTKEIGKETCVSGCGKCCKTNTPTCRIIEAIYAISVLTGTGKLKKAVSLAEGWLLEKHKETPSYDGRPTGFASPRIHQEWLDIRLTRCPFLQEDMRCFIHQGRPLVCRAFGVTFTGEETCDRPPGRGETLTQHEFVNSPKLRDAVNAFWDDCKQRKPEWAISGFIPTLLYRAAEPDKFKKMVLDNQVASAKIIGIDYEVNLMWQPQLEALRQGVSPDLVSVMR